MQRLQLASLDHELSGFVHAGLKLPHVGHVQSQSSLLLGAGCLQKRQLRLKVDNMVSCTSKSSTEPV